ncbi:MAG: hypothetical protein JWM59_3879 [Verrucomicrobiales bacterium]|nr:hypothetical protein [Verrucomicrobiales bacterium]
MRSCRVIADWPCSVRMAWDAGKADSPGKEVPHAAPDNGGLSSRQAPHQLLPDGDFSFSDWWAVDISSNTARDF